jgi:threonyl-tRNA synthetase
MPEATLAEEAAEMDVAFKPESGAAYELARMRAHQSAAEEFVREVVSREQALRIFGDNPYKVELIEGLPADEEITSYQH